MKNILKKKWLITGVLLILFVFTILISFHFFQENDKRKEIFVDPIVLPTEDELEFFNNSSLTDEEIELLVKSKKEELTTLFYDSSIYHLEDIDSTKTEEEKEKYTVLDEQFLQKLDEIVTENIYSNIFNQMLLLKNDLSHSFYMIEKNAFDSIYLDSAIADINVTSSILRLISATDEKINASVNICRDEKNCDTKESYPFELIKLNDEWKVNVFQK